MSTHSSDDRSGPPDVRRQQFVIMNHLLRAIATMYSIDELFQWLCYAFVEHFQIELVEFWTPLLTPARSTTLHLRMMLTRDPALPEQIVLNEQMSLIAQRLTFEQRGSQTLPIDALFPSHQSALLKRYYLHYCLGGFMAGPVLLPPPPAVPGPQEPLPFTVTYLLFLFHPPQQELPTAVMTILRQAFGLATNRGLLLNAQSRPAVPLTPPPAAPPSSAQRPGRLIPRRKEDAELLMSENPFSRSAVISDKRARLLHGAIDGVQNINELARSTGMEMRDVITALQVLVKMRRVELYEPDGRLASTEWLFEQQ